MRPIGQGDAKNLSRPSNVGDGSKPPAGVSILKGDEKPAEHSSSTAARGVPVGRADGATIAPGMASGTAHVLNAARATGIASTAPTTLAPSPTHQVMLAKAASLALSLHVPTDTSSFLALAAMLGEHLPLDARSLAAVRRAARRHGDDPAAARIAAHAVATGLDPDGATVDAMLAVMDSPADGDSPAGGDVSGDSSGGDESAGDTRGAGGNASGAGHDGHASGDGYDGRTAGALQAAAAEVAPDELEALSVALRQAATAAMCNKDFASLNVVDPAGNSWICVPFELSYGDYLFRGFMRLRYDGARRRVDRLVADIRCGSDRRILDLGGGSTKSIRYHADDEEERSAFESSFSAYGRVSTADVESGDIAEIGEYPEVDRHA